MELISENPTIMKWHGIWIVKISDVGKDFAEWVYYQTKPIVEESDTPSDWAYYSDYSRFANRFPVID